MMIDARSFQRAIVAVGSAEDVAPLISEATDVIAMSGGLDRDLTSIPAHEIAVADDRRRASRVLGR